MQSNSIAQYRVLQERSTDSVAEDWTLELTC